eukprot:72508_1
MPTLTTQKSENAVSKKETEITLPPAIEANLHKLSKPSHHKLTADMARNLLRLLRHCELENYSSAMRLDSKISLGNRSKIAISEYDILSLWKSFYRTPLNINHSKMMQQLIYVYYPYFEIHLVSDATKYVRYISIRDDPSVLSSDSASSATYGDRIPIYSADSFQAAVRDLLQHKSHSDGLYVSQIISKLSQSNQYVFTSAFFNPNWDERHSLWLLHAKNSDLSVIPSSPRYDPIVTAIESHHSIQDFITREVHGHDRRDGNGVSLSAILSLVRAVAPNFFNVEFQSVSASQKTKNVYFDDIIHFILDIGTVDLISVTGTLRHVTDLNDITVYASPEISELHESIKTIIDTLSRENQDSLTSVIDKIGIELMSKYPALNTAKYGFENDVESLIESTPHFSVYKPYPLSPSYMLSTPYVTLCDAISRALRTFDSNKSIVEVQLRSAVLSILNPNLSDANAKLDMDDIDDKIEIEDAESIHAVNIDKPIDAVKGLYEIYEKYLTDIPKYFSHLVQCEWNEQNQLWSFKPRIHDEDNLLFKVRSIFEEFDRNYTLLNTNKTRKTPTKHYNKQVKIPAHSFQQKWDLKYGEHSFKENQVENLLFSHPFIYVMQTQSKPENAAYIWQMQDHRIPTVTNALLLHLSELYVSNDNQCHLNQFQDLYAKIYGHPCVQSDIYNYLNRLGSMIDPETLMIDLQPSYYYHIPLPMQSLSKITYTNLNAFSQETGCKLLQKEDIDPYDSSLSEVNIASTMHRNLNGLYVKLSPLPTYGETSAHQVNEIIDGWMNRLCSKYLGHDIVPTSMKSAEISALQPLLSMPNQAPNDEHLNKIRQVMTLFEMNKTEKQSMKWNNKLIELLPRSTSQQSVTFDNIKDSLPFQNESQFLNEILFDPLCLSMINVEQDKESKTYSYSLNEEVDDMDIKSNVSTELILQNIISMNPQGIHLSEIKKYFPLHRLQLTADHSFIDWLQHRFAANITFDSNGFITWNNTDAFNQMMRCLNVAEMPHHSCKSRENTLNSLLFVDSTSVLSLMDAQTMTVPTYLNGLCQYIHNVSIHLPSLPSSIPYNLTENYDWLYHSFQLSYRPSSSNNLPQTHKTIPLKYITQQILDQYQQQMNEVTNASTEHQSDVNPEKLSMHSISNHMPLCLFASKLYDKLLSFNASLAIYLPLFKHLDHCLKLYGFQITKPSFSSSPDFQLIHIKPSQEMLHSASMPENVKTLYHTLLSNHDTRSIDEDAIVLHPDDMRYILNYCHRDIDIEYKQNKRRFSFRAPLSFVDNHSERTSILSKVYKRQSQIDDIAELLNSMKRNEKYMRLSQFIPTFAAKYNYLIPIEPLVHTLTTESNRYTKPIMTDLDDGDYFIAMDEESSLGARFESIFMDNKVNSLTMPELKSLWFKKFSQQHPYPDGSLFTLINQFSNKFVLSMEGSNDTVHHDVEDMTNYTLSLLNPHHKFSFRVKSLLNALQTHNTQPINVDDMIREWNATYTPKWHDNDTINLYLLPFVSISHPDQYQTKPMIAFDTNFIDIFSDIQGKWNLNMIERLDTMVKQILLGSQSKTVPLSQFQSKFLSFSGYIFPQSTNLIESLRQLPSITVDTSVSTQTQQTPTFCDPVIRLREHVNLHESPLSETLMLSEFDQVFQQKELISMNLSNFNKYYSQIFGKKFFQDISESDGTPKSMFYQLLKKTYNIWQINQNSDGHTIDWLIGIQKNVHNPSHKTTFYVLTNTILSEIGKSPNKKLYENELPQILPNSIQFKSKMLNNPNQVYPFDQYSNTAYFLMYNSPQQIAVQYDASNQPFFALRPKKFGSKSAIKTMVSSYTSLEEIVQDITANMDGNSMRLCDFQTLLFDKLPETTDWPWIFNKFPTSISSFINIDYSKLDRRITFENTTHLHQKVNHYIKSMKPNDSKLRENIMQQFYNQRQSKLSLQTLSESLDMKWPALLNKIINVFSLDFKVATPKTQSIPQTDTITLTHSDEIMIHYPPFPTLNRRQPSSQPKTKAIEQGLVLLALKYKDHKIPMHEIQQILYSLTENNMLYTSNLMQSLHLLGLGRMKLTDNNEHANTFTIPTIAIKGWENKLEQTIMNAFVSSLPIENGSSPPYLPYITESAMQSYLGLQFVKNTPNAKVFRALTDSLWADLYSDIDVNNDSELRFSLRPITKVWNAEEGRQLDMLLNHAPEKVMKLSQLQHTFYAKHNAFLQGEQSKRALSEFLSSKAKYCVLPLKNGDYLFTFATYSKNLLRYFVRDIVKGEDNKGFTLDQIQTEVESNCDLNRLKQLKIVKSSDSILPFPIHNYVLMDTCSDLIFPYYMTQPSAQNPIPTIIFRNRKKTNVASNVRDVMELYQQEHNNTFLSFSTLKTLLKQTYPTNYPEIEQNACELLKTIASFPWLRFHLDKTSIEPQQLLPPTTETDLDRPWIVSGHAKSKEAISTQYDWNIEITLNSNDIQHMRNDVSCEIFAALRQNDKTQSDASDKQIDEDGRTYRNVKGNNDLTMKAATFQNKFSGLTGLFYNPSYQSVTHYLLQISYSTKPFPHTLPEMDSDEKMKQLFASRFFGVRLSEINELLHQHNYFEFSWCLPRLIKSDPNITLIEVPYGPPDYFVVHSELNTMTENDIIMRLQEIFKKQRMFKSNTATQLNAEGTDCTTLLTESQIRSEWKAMFGRDIPFAYSMDLYHAFSHHFNDYITVHSFGNNKMFSMNDVQLLYNIAPVLSPELVGTNREIAKFVQKDQLSQQRKKIFLSDAIDKISNDMNYRSAEELLYSLYETQASDTNYVCSTADAALMITNKPDVVNVTFSQLFRNVLQPLKLEIGRSQSMDWLSFLMFRFNGFLSLLPQNVPDLQFSLQNMAILQEKCWWIKASRVNPMVNFNVYEREHVLASLTQNEEEDMSLSALYQSGIGEYFWANHGTSLHHHIVRTLSCDVDIQHMASGNAAKSILPMPKHSAVDEKWSPKYDEFTVSLRSSAPQLRFCDIFEPVSEMLRRLDLSHDKLCGMNEIQNQFYMLFGAYIPSTNLKATLIRYGAISSKPSGVIEFANVQMSQSKVQRTQNDIIVDAIIDYMRSKLIHTTMHSPHSDSKREEWFEFDEIMAYLNTLEINLGDKATLFEDIIHYLIDKRSLDFALSLDHESHTTNHENQNHQNPHKSNWKIQLRPFISETNGNISCGEVHDLLNNNVQNGAIKLSQIQSALYDKYHKIIEVSPRTQFSLYHRIVDLIKSGGEVHITPCGADSIVYTEKMSMYREAVRYALSYYCGGLRTHQLRNIIDSLLAPRAEYEQFSTEKLNPSKDISAIYQILSNCCFSFCQIIRDPQTGVYRIAPFDIWTVLAHKIRAVIDKVSLIKHLMGDHPDGVLLEDVKQELIKEKLWNTKTHEFILSAPFLCIKRDAVSNMIRISCLNETQISSQKNVILHHIVCENVLKCNTYNLQDMYCNVTGTLLDLGLSHTDDKGNEMMISHDAHQKILKENSLKELLIKCNLRLHHDPQSRENLILPKTTIVRLKKPWLTRDKQLRLRHSLSQLAKQYRIRFVDFVEEFVLEVPTFIATSTFFIHGSGLASVLTPKDLDLIIEHITNVTHNSDNTRRTTTDVDVRFYSNYQTKHRNAMTRSDLDMTIHGENFAIMMGLDCAHLLRLTFFRGTIRSFLRRLTVNNIRLSQIQELYETYMNGSRWWSTNIPDELRRLNCVLYADGYGDFMIDISHLRPMYDDKSVRGDLSFKIM